MYRSGSVLMVTFFYVSWTAAESGSQMAVLSPQLTRCSHERAYDMYGAYCAGLRLNRIPSLKSSIEILDFSDNRLYELEADTFSSYTSLKFLYLSENQIYRIDKDAFAPLPYLQILDLSSNVILELPETIFQLPMLRNLYLKNNPVLQLSFNSLHLSKPIKAPLELLDISNSKIKTLPNWGTLPHLIQYNISYNSLDSLDAHHFAAMCNLKKVDLTKSIDDIKPCKMKSAIIWIQLQEVYFQMDDYSKLNSKEFGDCPIDESMEVLNATHTRCKTNPPIWGPSSNRRTWLTITGGLAGFLIGFILLLYLMHRHNVAQTKAPAQKIKKVTPKNDSDRHAAVPILNEVSDVSKL